MDAHFPYVPPAPFDRSFPGKIRSMTQDDLTEVQERVVSGQPMDAGEYAHFISQYDGGIAYDDAHVGQVIRWLKRRGMYDNTMIVVASDHGEQFGEKGHGPARQFDLPEPAARPARHQVSRKQAHRRRQ